MNGVLVAVGTELFQFHPTGSVAPILGGCVAGHARRSLLKIGATLRTFQGNNDTNALSHESSRGKGQVGFNANTHLTAFVGECALKVA